MTTAPLDEDHADHDVRMDGVYFRRASVDAPFVKSLDPGNYSYCVMVRSGQLRLETDFPVPSVTELVAGDAIAVSGLTPHVFCSSGSTSFDEAGRFSTRSMADNAPMGEVDLVVGVAPDEAIAMGSLMMGPIVVRPSEHPDLSHRLWAVLELLEVEYADASWIDRNLVIRRLAEIMLVNFARRFFAGSQGDADRPRGPASRPIMAAIDAFFREPARAWTVSELARTAGMSRTRFAEEFRDATGQTPVRIISRMRLTAAARRLATEALNLEAAAEDAGYSSAAAFVRAFQREFGETPARWRRQRRGNGSDRRVQDRGAMAREAARETR